MFFYFAIHLLPVEEGEFLLYILLNTLRLDMLYGKDFLAILPMRTVKNLIMWPIDSFIFFTITRLIEQTGIFNLFRKPAAN